MVRPVWISVMRCANRPTPVPKAQASTTPSVPSITDSSTTIRRSCRRFLPTARRMPRARGRSEHRHDLDAADEPLQAGHDGREPVDELAPRVGAEAVAGAELPADGG